MPNAREISLTVNGENHILSVEPHVSLLELLREDLGLTGTKEGCGHGDCGACIVIMDGKAVNACLVLAVDADGSAVTTIEGLAEDGALHPLQEAFLDKGAVQCGFCSSGMMLSAKALLERNPKADADEIRREIVGVLCRCGTYPRVIEAVLKAGRNMADRNMAEAKEANR